MPRKLLTPQIREEICLAWERGDNPKEICARYGVTYNYPRILYLRMRGRLAGEVRYKLKPPKRIPLQQRRNQEFIARLARKHHFESFEEAGWQDFGMIVLE